MTGGQGDLDAMQVPISSQGYHHHQLHRDLDSMKYMSGMTHNQNGHPAPRTPSSAMVGPAQHGHKSLVHGGTYGEPFPRAAPSGY